MSDRESMHEHEKVAIEADARRESAERGHHGAAMARYLQVAEEQALKEYRKDTAAGESRRPEGERQS